MSTVERQFDPIGCPASPIDERDSLPPSQRDRQIIRRQNPNRKILSNDAYRWLMDDIRAAHDQDSLSWAARELNTAFMENKLTRDQLDRLIEAGKKRRAELASRR
jgi:hypothetical protein